MLKFWENYITEIYDPAKQIESPEVETEVEVGERKKCLCILHREAEKDINELKC